MFKIVQGNTWAVLDTIRVHARHSKRSAMIDRLRSEDGNWGGVLGGRDPNHERDRDMDETQQLGMVYGGGSDRWGIA